MRFGVCTKIENAPIVHGAGFDFIECTVVSLQPEESDAAVRDIIARFHESEVPVEAFNVLLPGDLKVVGEHVDYDRIRRYLAKAMERVKAVGGETVVFGSGKARMVPEGFSRTQAEEQIVRFLDLLADEADPLGVTVAIEPLNATECNIITSVPEAAEYARQVNRKSIRVLADTYHMVKDNEPLENIAAHKELLRHVHVSDNSRFGFGNGDFPHESFVDTIQQANYDGRISIECTFKDFAVESASGLSYLRSLLSPEK
ncbi:sugar phosphate isomerase/epimerase [Paenibacillus mesophilus]|uniref:sugar phosphate isomerase/epimerase family protein n=1 Tax=Paenibacillus mesophilus TaxID=2582849 RepID=UPI00110DB819|nr:sugar phosphate isomerase/epimerase family protein [Paenibacillus mesophilus]TMV49965.1 sugar phosphate isomerase/epimerase [Paenibacillus mesophilus]